MRNVVCSGCRKGPAPTLLFQEPNNPRRRETPTELLLASARQRGQAVAPVSRSPRPTCKPERGDGSRRVLLAAGRKARQVATRGFLERWVLRGGRHGRLETHVVECPKKPGDVNEPGGK